MISFPFEAVEFAARTIVQFRKRKPQEELKTMPKYAVQLSAGGVADEWVTQLLRQGDAKVFKKYFADEIADEAGGFE